VKLLYERRTYEKPLISFLNDVKNNRTL